MSVRLSVCPSVCLCVTGNKILDDVLPAILTALVSGTDHPLLLFTPHIPPLPLTFLPSLSYPSLLPHIPPHPLISLPSTSHPSLSPHIPPLPLTSLPSPSHPSPPSHIPPFHLTSLPTPLHSFHLSTPPSNSSPHVPLTSPPPSTTNHAIHISCTSSLPHSFSLLPCPQDDEDQHKLALDALRQTMKVKSKALLPYLVPKVCLPVCVRACVCIRSEVSLYPLGLTHPPQLVTPPINANALAVLSSVAGESLQRFLPKIVPALLAVAEQHTSELDHEVCTSAHSPHMQPSHLTYTPHTCPIPCRAGMQLRALY